MVLRFRGPDNSQVVISMVYSKFSDWISFNHFGRIPKTIFLMLMYIFHWKITTKLNWLCSPSQTSILTSLCTWSCSTQRTLSSKLALTKAMLHNTFFASSASCYFLNIVLQIKKKINILHHKRLICVPGICHNGYCNDCKLVWSNSQCLEFCVDALCQPANWFRE